MSPNTSDGGTSNTGEAASGERGTEPDTQTKREQFNVLTQETRFTLVQNILAHPKQLPSLKELDYYNPSKSKSTIRNHLDTLAEHGLVEERVLREDERKRDLPWKFYGLTDVATELLREANLLEAEETLQDIYELLELNEEIARYADAPRPSDGKEDSPVETEIRVAKSNTESVEDQIAVVQSMYDAGIGPDHPGLTASDLKESLSVETSFHLRTSLTHLEEIGLVEAVTPTGPDVYAISERLDEIINGKIEEVATDDLENLIAHMEDELYAVDISDVQKGDVVAIADGGTTIRSILATEFGIDPEAVESYLRKGDSVEKLNTAVDAIEGSDKVSSGGKYGRIIFRRPANRYRLTNRAVEHFEGAH